MTFKFEEGKDHGKFNGTENQFKIVGEKRERRERDMRAGGEKLFLYGAIHVAMDGLLQFIINL